MYEYLTFLPEGYEVQDIDYPLIVYLHDAGQNGYEFDLVRNSGLPKLLISKQIKLEMIVVAPQAPPCETWKATKLLQMLNVLTMQYRIDKQNIFFIGVGTGGYGSLKFATVHKEIPKAIISIAGGGNENMAFYLQNTKIWLFHGTNDEVIPFYKAKALANALEQAGANFRFDAIENGKHDIADKILTNAEIYKWLQING